MYDKRATEHSKKTGMVGQESTVYRTIRRTRIARTNRDFTPITRNHEVDGLSKRDDSVLCWWLVGGKGWGGLSQKGGRIK